MTLIEKILLEAIIQKPILGSGSFKNVYPLKTNPDYIIKHFDRRYNAIVEKEYDFYKKAPDVCAKIVRIDFEKGFLIQEKLDTISFEMDCKELSKQMGGRDIFYLFRNVMKPEEIQTKFKFNYRNQFLNELIDFLKKCKILFRSFDIDYTADLTEFNLGYDKKGNIKLLDW